MALSFSPPFLVFSLLRSIFHVVESISILSSVFSSHLLRKTLSAHITLAVLCLFLFLYKSLSPPHSLYLIALLMFCAPSNSFSHALTSLSLSLPVVHFHFLLCSVLSLPLSLRDCSKVSAPIRLNSFTSSLFPLDSTQNMEKALISLFAPLPYTSLPCPAATSPVLSSHPSCKRSTHRPLPLRPPAPVQCCFRHSSER